MWIDAVTDFLGDYWEQLVTLATLGIVLITYWRARSVWKARDFMTRVNFTLNYLDGNTLKLRTCRETDIDRVLLSNEHGKRVVLRAARKTTAEQPFLRLGPRDSWLVLNSMLNELSEQFAAGFLAASMGMPTRAARYVLAITCEKHRDVRMNKIRVMIVQKSLLLEMDKLQDIELESKSHHVRFETLQSMRKLYLEPDAQHAFIEIELAVPAGAA